jgi:hypothetical protein
VLTQGKQLLAVLDDGAGGCPDPGSMKRHQEVVVQQATAALQTELDSAKTAHEAELDGVAQRIEQLQSQLEKEQLRGTASDAQVSIDKHAAPLCAAGVWWWRTRDQRLAGGRCWPASSGAPSSCSSTSWRCRSCSGSTRQLRSAIAPR